MKASIIIAAYNIETYIRRCIISIINQTLKDIEIIVVNDGSTDNTLGIIKELYKLDNRIIIVNQENKGLIEARKSGLNIAKGEYILFVDGDDWIDNELLAHYIMKIEEESGDLLISEYKSHINKQCITQTPDYSSGVISIDEAYFMEVYGQNYFS